MNGRIYRYLISNPLAPPVTFSDPSLGIDSFHVRCSLSACGRYLACGSSGGGAFIWSVEYPEWPPIRLITSTIEVSLVLWNPFQVPDCHTSLELCSATDAAEVQLWGAKGNDSQPWTPQLAPFLLEFNAFECINRVSNPALIMKSIPEQIPALMHLPSLVDLSPTSHSPSQQIHGRLPSPPTFDLDYEVMLKENSKPNNNSAFGTPIKFPFSPKNSSQFKQQKLGINKNKRSSLY